MVPSLDTDPEIERLQIERYRSMSPAEKLARVVDLNRTAEAMAMARLEKTYGPLDREELERRLAALRLDRETRWRAPRTSWCRSSSGTGWATRSPTGSGAG